MKLKVQLELFLKHFLHRNGLLTETPKEPLETLFSPPPKGNLNERFDAYSEGYGLRIIDGMKEIFEVIPVILGEDSFRELCHRYIRQFPSRNSDLGAVGVHLPQFLKEDPLAQSSPFLMPLSELELALWKSFHGDASECFTAEDLRARLATGDMWLRFVLKPTTRLLKNSWSIFELWNSKGRMTEERPTTPATEYLIVHRQGPIATCHPIIEDEFVFLNRLSKSESFGEILEDTSIESQNRVVEWMQRWGQWNIFREITNSQPEQIPTGY